MIHLPGLDGVGNDAASRRRELAHRSDDELAAQLVNWMLSLRTIDAAKLAQLARLPYPEVIASPFGLRAIALGVELGVAAVHRETRSIIHSEGWSYGVEDPDHGRWDRGSLHVGKYQSFQADAPFASFDPQHVAKWGPHEMLHRAVGFFFRDDMSKFELYLGARLNELLPVVTWYGHDQLARLDDDDFDRARAQRAVGLGDVKWWTESEDKLRVRVRHTLHHLRAGIAHFEHELDVINEELGTRRRISSPRFVPGAKLDAASDATAYVVGHWARMNVPAVRAVLERVPHLSSIPALRERVETVHDRLLFGAIDIGTTRRVRAIRQVWDWLLRCALMDSERTLSILKESPPLDAIEDWTMRIDDAFGADADIVLADGGLGVDLTQLVDGVVSVAPRTQSALPEGWEDEFVDCAHFWDRAPLQQRLGRWIDEQELAPWVRELLWFEELVARDPIDDAVPHLVDPEGDFVMRSERFSLFVADHDVVAVHIGALLEAPPADSGWLVGHVDGQIAVLDVDRSVRRVWEELGHSAMRFEDVCTILGMDAVNSLIRLGALGRVG